MAKIQSDLFPWYHFWFSVNNLLSNRLGPRRRGPWSWLTLVLQLRTTWVRKRWRSGDRAVAGTTVWWQLRQCLIHERAKQWKRSGSSRNAVPTHELLTAVAQRTEHKWQPAKILWKCFFCFENWRAVKFGKDFRELSSHHQCHWSHL